MEFKDFLAQDEQRYRDWIKAVQNWAQTEGQKVVQRLNNDPTLKGSPDAINKAIASHLMAYTNANSLLTPGFASRIIDIAPMIANQQLMTALAQGHLPSADFATWLANWLDFGSGLGAAFPNAQQMTSIWNNITRNLANPSKELAAWMSSAEGAARLADLHRMALAAWYSPLVRNPLEEALAQEYYNWQAFSKGTPWLEFLRGRREYLPGTSFFNLP